jgi:small-conductance mechanosensitive channel
LWYSTLGGTQAGKGLTVSMAEHVRTVYDSLDSIIVAAAGWAAQPTPTGAPVDGPAVNTEGIIQFIATKIVPILLAVIGVIFISRAGKGEMSRVLTSSGIVILGLAFIVGGLAMFAFSRAVVDLIFPAPSGP